MSDFDLTGKVCIVTGAGRGIGRGMAEGLARHGATVVLTGRTRATLEEAASSIGDKAIVETADVSKEADVLALRDAVLQRCGKIDVLVNNAGVNAIFKGIERTTLAEWQAGATEFPGSWWHDWDKWLSARSGPKVPARVPGEGALPALEDAPGSYVQVRSGQ